MILLLAGCGILIAASGDGIFNGADLLAWVLILLGIVRTHRTSKGTP